MDSQFRWKSQFRRKGKLGIVAAVLMTSFLLAALGSFLLDSQGSDTTTVAGRPRTAGGSAPWQDIQAIQSQDSYTLRVTSTLYDWDSTAILAYFHWYVRAPGESFAHVRAVCVGPVSWGQQVSDTLSRPTFGSGYEVLVYADVYDYSNWGSGTATPIFTVPANLPPYQSVSDLSFQDSNTLVVTNTLYDDDAPASFPTLYGYFHWKVKHVGESEFTELADYATHSGPVYPGQTVTATLTRGFNTFDEGDEVMVYTDVWDGINWGPGDGTPPQRIELKKWAVIVGISDYDVISDLYAGDNDATRWSTYLKVYTGYDHIRVLGDTTSSYPAEFWYRYASEANVKNSLTWLAGADGDDVVSFIFCGHGSGPTGSSSLCTWDCDDGESGQDGWLHDTELDDYIGSWRAQNIFIFLASCHSGGFIPEIQALSNSAHIYLTTTCTQAGYGWDFVNYMAWTKSFLIDGFVDHFGGNPATTMEECFDYALPGYPCDEPEYEGGAANTPQEFDGNPGVGFTL